MYIRKYTEVLEVLDRDNLQLRADKCRIACEKIE